MALVLFIVLIVYYNYQGFEINFFKLIFYLPLGLILTIFTTFGLGCFIASLNVKYRDFRYIIPFLIQFLLFVTPVIYPVSIFADSWLETILSLNPMTGAISFSRAAFTNEAINWTLLSISTLSSFFIF